MLDNIDEDKNIENIKNIEINEEKSPAVKEKWFAIYVPTGKEEYAKNYIQKQLDGAEVFIPKVTVQRKAKGEIQTSTIPLFKGYIFVISSDEEMIGNLLEVSKGTDKIYKLLKYSDSEGCVLHDSDVEILTAFLDKEKIMQSSVGIIIGDEIIIKRGPLVGKESIIKKINRHKMQATVQIEMMGRMCDMQVPLEIVEKKI
ncbi:MAG: antiterminator LoaP [Bacillota bacterium]